MKTNIALIILLAFIASGCGYSSKSLYRSDIQTVCLEMFGSNSFDREVEFELTAALGKKIELLTPYKVVADRSSADSIIYGKVKSVEGRILSQQRDLDRPIQEEVKVVVEVTWKALRGKAGVLIDGQDYSFHGDQNDMVGISRNGAISQAVDKLSDEIVVSMTKDW
ncbi:MAG: hypothetical protein JEZ07_16985 [Phycisphaerae bacterium]|nr:hypothetical protein [Phycisphaerae bacterium]